MNLLTYKFDFTSLNFSNASEAIHLLVELKKIIDFMDKQKPTIPQCKIMIGNPFQIKINQGNLISSESLSPYDRSVLIDYSSKWGKSLTNGLKLNIILVDQSNTNKDKFINLDFFYNGNNKTFAANINKYFYIDHSIHVQDEQTILSIDSLYSDTHRICSKNGNSKIYKNKNKYYYLDSKHQGEGAHIEVFRSESDFFGTVNIYGEDERKAKKKRTCNTIPVKKKV